MWGGQTILPFLTTFTTYSRFSLEKTQKRALPTISKFSCATAIWFSVPNIKPKRLLLRHIDSFQGNLKTLN